MKTSWILFAALMVSVECDAEFLVYFPDDRTAGTFIGGGYIRTEGYEFTVGNSPILVSRLGFRDRTSLGLNNSHDLGLWDSNGTLLASLTIAAGNTAPLEVGFRFAALQDAILLNPGRSYVLGATYINEDTDLMGIARTFEGASPVYDPNITFDEVRFQDSTTGMTFPDIEGITAELGLFGPNLEFTVVPEPSELALAAPLVIAMYVVSQRNRILRTQVKAVN